MRYPLLDTYGAPDDERDVITRPTIPPGAWRHRVRHQRQRRFRGYWGACLVACALVAFMAQTARQSDQLVSHGCPNPNLVCQVQVETVSTP